MKLYHFTSECHLYGIARHGLTVGDVPTDIRLHRGLCAVWLTSDDGADGHGLDGATVDKTRFRLTVNAPEDSRLVRWVEWAPRNVTPPTIQALHEAASGFDTWWVYFGVIEPAAIKACTDMQTGTLVKNWTARARGLSDVPAVPSWRRGAWHKGLRKGGCSRPSTKGLPGGVLMKTCTETLDGRHEAHLRGRTCEERLRGHDDKSSEDAA